MIRTRGVDVVYPGGTAGLRGVELDVRPGEFMAIVGPSGAGKSTLLRCLKGLVRPARGSILVGGVDVTRVKDRDLREVTRTLALIPQQLHLVPRLSVLASVLTGRLGHVGLVRGLLGLYSGEDRRIALDQIARVGLGDKADRRVDTLSGGEQQRVAICRALAQRPELILADEPVSSLEHALATTVMEILRDINRRDGIGVVIALHDLRLVEAFADRVIALERGSVVYDGSCTGMTQEDLGALTKTSPAA